MTAGPPPLQQLGRYTLLKKIATGGMAEIFLAKQRGEQGFEKLVVIKKVLPQHADSEEFVQMLLEEAKLAAGLNHPNIVQIFDLGRTDDSFFIAMEYVQGESLRAIWKACRKRGQPVPLEQAVYLIGQACLGLHHAHTRTGPDGRSLNLVHRDISPPNILASFEGAVKVVDFGIAKASSGSLATHPGVFKGKFPYMSPEQCQGLLLDHRSDIFSMGIVLWELLTGTRLYQLDAEMAIARAIIENPPPPPHKLNPAVGKDLEAVVLKAMHKKPARRFQSAQELEQALTKVAHQSGFPGGMASLAGFLRRLFPDKHQSLQRIEQAQAAGTHLESVLFDDLTFDTGGGSGSTPLFDSVQILAPPVRAEPEAEEGAELARLTEPGVSPPAGPPPLPKPKPSAPAQLPEPARSAPAPAAPPAQPARSWLVWWVAGVLVLLVLAAGAYLVLRWIPDGSAGSSGAGAAAGSLQITSTPSEATVSVDGVYRCFTPCLLEHLAPGSPHTVRISKAGFHDHQAKATVAASGPMVELDAVLKPLRR